MEDYYLVLFLLLIWNKIIDKYLWLCVWFKISKVFYLIMWCVKKWLKMKMNLLMFFLLGVIFDVEGCNFVIYVLVNWDIFLVFFYVDGSYEIY